MEELTCKLHSIETLGTVDGPGIRFIAFLQGCPLQCKYCHNRDTWDFHSGEIITLEKLLNKILRSKTYIDSSNGGVTISGGEPLIQAKFVTELFKKLKQLNIHTAIDTAGSLPINDNIKELLSYTDLVLLDMKHIDNEKCIELTGLPNTNTINFANYLKENKIPMWIRQVLVPTITDDENDLLKLKEFINNYDNLENFEFLPYHNLGKSKWEKLGLIYPLEHIRPANQDDIDRAKQILNIE